MTLLVSAWTIGLILALVALGVFITFRIFAFPDITVDGSSALGAALVASLITAGLNPWLATAGACLGGVLAGATTAVLHTKFKINALLSGILVMTALYSVNLRIMGKSNLPLSSVPTLATNVETLGAQITAGSQSFSLIGWSVGVREMSMLLASALVAALVAFILYAFFRTNLGTAMRATGDNSQMIRALGVNVETMIILGVALSNGLIALAGALLAQYQGFADVQMGIGMVVWGLASVILGEALVGTGHLGLTIVGAIMGSVLFRLMVALVLRAGLNANDLKLITAVFVFVAMVLPQFLARFKIKAKN